METFSAVWSLAACGSVTIRFYARDLAGNIGTAFVIVVRTSAQEELPPRILRYSVYLLIGRIGVISTIFVKRKRKS